MARQQAMLLSDQADAAARLKARFQRGLGPPPNPPEAIPALSWMVKVVRTGVLWPGEALQQLEAAGWSQDDAIGVVKLAEDAVRGAENFGEWAARGIGGALLLAIGVVIVWGSYENASPGGRYLIWTWPILAGVVLSLRGIWAFTKLMNLRRACPYIGSVGSYLRMW